MRLTKFIVLFVICTLAISIAIPAFAAGTATYKAKCAACHGPEGQAKSVRP
jgi:mono/diheme cytochrome c family protein